MTNLVVGEVNCGEISVTALIKYIHKISGFKSTCSQLILSEYKKIYILTIRIHFIATLKNSAEVEVNFGMIT